MSIRKVKFARFHSGIFIGSLGDLGDHLPPKSKTIPNLQMSWDGAALYVTAGVSEFVIPSANVKFAEFAPEEQKAPAVKVEPKKS